MDAKTNPTFVDRPFRVAVPCSTSNLGCGFDCLGLALERELTVEVLPARVSGARLVAAAGTLAEAPLAGEERIARAATEMARRLGRPLPGLEFRALSTIPVARGLGSSGAATVAGLVSAAAALGLEPGLDALFDAGCALEGHPDNIGPALVGGCVVAMPDERGHVSWFAAPVHPELRAAVAVPKTRLETARARGVLPTNVAFSVARDQARRLAQLLQGLRDLDERKLALGSQDLLHTPYRLPLIRGGARAIEAAREAGAFAATISGSGSAIVALGTGPMTTIAAAMRDAFERAGEQAEAFASAIPARGYSISAIPGNSPS
jgi:homoserine kinase